MKEFQRSRIMGLSIVSRLQQSKFISNPYRTYIGRFTGSNLIVYHNNNKGRKKGELTEERLNALRSKKFTGVLSRKSQTKIIQICQNWQDTLAYRNKVVPRGTNITEKQIIMLTLTLSLDTQLTDQYIKRYMLTYFITSLIRSKPDTHYLWKAETQKNGRIHFHVLLDNYFDKERVRQLWNSIQLLHLGVSDPELVEKVKASPSTRIEALKNKDSTIDYVAKYITKNEGKRLVQGRLWGCSNELKELKPIEFCLSKDEITDIMTETLPNEKQYYVNQYCLYYTHFPNVQETKEHFFNMHTSSFLILSNNLEKLYINSLFGAQEIEQTPWFRDLCAEMNPLMASYALNNGLLFSPDEQYLLNIF